MILRCPCVLVAVTIISFVWKNFKYFYKKVLNMVWFFTDISQKQSSMILESVVTVLYDEVYSYLTPPWQAVQRMYCRYNASVVIQYSACTTVAISDNCFNELLFYGPQ